MTRFNRIGLLLPAFFLLANANADSVLWYNGDYQGGSATVNENANNYGAIYIFDEFTVTSPGGWLVQRLWSNNCMNYSGVTSAAWSIRTGMPSGNGGTLIASGTSSAQQIPTGRAGWWGGYPEYTIEVSGLSLQLNPGTYWLSVAPLVGNDPVSNGQFRSYLSTTWGANAVGTPTGTPAGGDGNSFQYWPGAGHNFTPAPFGEDYSMGVAGVAVVPEPTAATLGGLGILGLYVRLRRRRRNERCLSVG